MPLNLRIWKKEPVVFSNLAMVNGPDTGVQAKEPKTKQNKRFATNTSMKELISISLPKLQLHHFASYFHVLILIYHPLKRTRNGEPSRTSLLHYHVQPSRYSPVLEDGRNLISDFELIPFNSMYTKEEEDYIYTLDAP